MKFELSQKLEPRLELTLEQILSPKVLQMLKLLSLPYIELVDKIKKEAEENVMLEVEREDELFEYIKYINSDKKIKKEADFSEVPGLENIGDTSRTLEETLLEQLELENLDKTHEKIARQIIENIDGRGYIENYIEVREKIMKKLKVSRPTVDKVLKIVQSFEPDGVGARDLKECLLIQIREHNFENKELEDILVKAVSKHLNDIGDKKFKKVAESLGIQAEGVERIAEFIKLNLDPNPASQFATTSRHVIPSFSIEKTEKGHTLVNLEKNYGPLLKISARYMKMLEDPKTDAETLKFLKEKFESAKELMLNLQRRHETSERIMNKIKDAQSEFLNRGPLFLKPLLQKELAAEFGVHPSTISRAVSEKYIQTPKGHFPVKHLLPRNHKGFTQEKLKSMISSIVDSEDKNNPLSDDEIREKLSAQGAEAARRTVAAYRKELEIPPAKERTEKGP